MKTCIKSLLAIATVALLGSSAWAAEVTPGENTLITLTVGESVDVTGPSKDDGRWWNISASSSYNSRTYTDDLAKALAIATPAFDPAQEDRAIMSKGSCNGATIRFTGVAAGTTKFYIYGAKDEGTTPAEMPAAPYSGGGKSWSANNLNPKSFEITVIDPDDPGDNKWTDVNLIPDGDAKAFSQTGSSGDAWTTLVKGDTDCITVEPASGTGAKFEFSIVSTAVKGSATVYVKKNGTSVWGYRVKVADPTAKSLITSSVTPTGTDDQPIYSFTDTAAAGSLTIPKNYKATARILVIGGGAKGSDGTGNRGASGGYGGQGSDANNVALAANDYTITIGAGQTANTSAGASKFTGGTVTYTGAAAGNRAGFNSTSDITGERVSYGQTGATGANRTRAQAGGAGTGNGGQGGYGTSTYKNGGNGGSGIVIVKILSFEALPKPAVKSAIAGTLTYGQALSTIGTIGATMTNAQGQAVSGSFVWNCDTTVKPTVAESGVAQYAATFTPSSSDYWSPVKVKLAVTVNRKTLTATATSFSVERGRSVTAEDYVVTYSGWVNGESAATAAGFEPATATSEYSPTTTYPDNMQLDIIVSGGEADNYAFSYVNGKLTVLKPSKSDVQLTDVDKSSGVNEKNIDDETGRPVVMLDGKTYTFDADANNSEIALMDAGKYAVPDSYQLEGDEISKFLLGEFAGESFAEAFLPEGAWFTDGSFAISADGTTVTFDGGTLSYNDDDFTVPFAGMIELAGDLTISVGDELTVKFLADVTFTGSGKIIKTGAGTLDFDGEVTDVSAEGYEGEVDGEVHQPTVSYTFTPAATVDPARTAVVQYKQAGESAWTTEAPSFSEVIDTTVDYQILVAGILKASGTYAVKITQKEPETEPISIVMGESQKVTCEGVFDEEEWTVTITGADGLVTVDPREFTGKVFQPTITAGNAKGTATVTIASDNVKYVYTVTVVASYDEGKVNLAYAGEGMADEVTMFYWYRNSDTKYKPRHMQATPNPGSSYANTDRSAEAVAACNAILDVALNATNAYACVDTRMVAKTSEGETKVGVWRSSNALEHDDKYDPEGVKTKLGGTPQDSGQYSVVLKPKRVVYVGKSIKAYCTTSFDAASGSRIYLSAPWTAESADEDVATITASGDAATSFEPEFTGVGVGRTYATVGNLQISTGMSADGSWPSDVTAPSPAPSVVTNGASYKLWVEVRDKPVADVEIPAQGLYKGNALSAIALPADLVTMKDKAGTTITGTWAWEDGSIEPETSGSFNAVFTPDASFEFHDEVTVEVPVTVYEPVAVPTAVDGLTYDGTEQTGVAAGDGYTLDGNTAKNAGSHTATATLEAGCCWENVDGTLDFEDKTIAWSIAAKALTDEMVELDETSFTYNGKTQKPEVTVADSEAEITEDDYTISNEGGVDAGEYPVKVEAKGNYTGTVIKRYSIAKATYDMSGVTFENKTEVYNGEEQTVEIAGDLPEGVTVDYAGNTLKNVGETTATASFKGDAKNYEPITDKTATLTITAKGLTVEGLTAADKTYDGTMDAALTGGALKGVVEGDDVTATMPTAGEFADADVGADKKVTFEAIELEGAAAANYTLTQPELTASITAKGLTVEGLTAADKTYDGTTAAVLSGGELEGVVEGDDVTATMPTAGAFADKDVGADKAVTFAAITLEGGDAANYTLTQPELTASITAKEVGLNWTDTTFMYDGKPHKPTATATGLCGDDVAVTVEGEQTAAGGPYTATATALTGEKAGNYKLPAEVTTQFTINKSSEKPWADGADPEGEAYELPEDANDWTSLTNEAAYSEFDYRGAYDGEAHTIDTNALVAAYEAVCYAAPTITYSCDTNANDWAAAPIELTDVGATSVWYKVSVPNYEDVIRVAKIVIDYAQATVTANDASKFEDQDDPSFTAKVAGEVAGEEGTIKYTLEREEGEDVDTYAIIPSGDEIQGNYKVAYVNGTFTIYPKPTITIHIKQGDWIADVKFDGESVNKDLELSAETTEVELELEAYGLTVPVFKVVRGNVTNVTTKVETYAIADGDTLEFFAEEAAEDDPTVTPEQRKDAIIDAIDEPDWYNEDDVKRYYKAIDKVEDVVGADADQVPAKEFAAYIKKNTIKSEQIADCDYVAASVKLDTDDLIDEDTEVEIAELVKAEGNALTFEVDIENARVAVEAIKDMVEASSDLTDWVKNKLEVNAEFDEDECKVTITPVNPTDKAFMRVVIPQDPGVK